MMIMMGVIAVVMVMVVRVVVVMLVAAIQQSQLLLQLVEVVVATTLVHKADLAAAQVAVLVTTQQALQGLPIKVLRAETMLAELKQALEVVALAQ